MSKCLDTTLSAVPSTAGFTDILGHHADDSPTRCGLLCLCLGVRWGNREGVGDSPGLTWLFSCLSDFAKCCVFTGMYSGSSANHNGPSPGILPPPNDVPSRHHPLDSTLSSPHHHQSPLESARDGYVCET